MLVLTRRPGEAIRIGDEVSISVVEIQGTQVRLAIDAPREIPVHREEIWEQVRDENRRAAGAAPDVDPSQLWHRGRKEP